MRYDIVVVGAGPAGIMAAKAAARETSVLLIDENLPGHDPPACAEGVGDAVLRSLGIPEQYSWIENRVHNIKVVSPYGNTRTLKMKGLTALMLNRPKFEADLAAQAVAAGADYWYEHQVTDWCHGNGENITMTRDLRTGERHEIRSAVVIDCSGLRGIVAKKAGLHRKLKSSDIGVCAQLRLSSPEIDKNMIELWFGEANWAPRGYCWIFPKGDYANVGIGIQGGQKENAAVNLYAFINSRFHQFECRDLVRACLPLAPPLEKVSTDEGIMVAGDAARFCIATTGAGIGMSLWSGRMAGVVASTYISKGYPLNNYDRVCHEEIIPKLKRAYALKERITKSDPAMQRFYYMFLPAFYLHKLLPRTMEKYGARNMRFA